MSDLFNTVLAALARPRKGVFGYNQNKYADHCRRRSQRSLISAQKFVVCDSLLEHAVVASFSPPRTLLDMCECAVPPFNNMWIEWDEHKRMKAIIKHGTKLDVFPADYDWEQRNWGEEVGYHIERDDHPFSTYEQYAYMQGQIMCPPMGVSLMNDREFDASEYKHTSADGITPTRQEARRQQAKLGKLLLGRHYVGQWKFDEADPLHELYYRFNPCLSSSGNMLLPKRVAPEDQAGLAEKSAITVTGDMRFLIAVIALLNYPHTVVERTTEATPPRLMWGRRVPRNEVKVLEIDLPKPRGTTRYERMFKGGGGKKRRHVRRGHWRRFRHRDGTVSTRWIGEQWVGSEEVGTITHDYELKSKGAK